MEHKWAVYLLTNLTGILEEFHVVPQPPDALASY